MVDAPVKKHLKKMLMFLSLVFIVCLFVTQVDSTETKKVQPADLHQTTTAKPFGMTKRVLWKTSQVKGRPEPPLPFRSQQIFSHLHFSGPTLLTNAPGTDRLFIAERTGKIYSIPNDLHCKQADIFLDVNELLKQINQNTKEQDRVTLDAVYGLAFHPDFINNRYCYLCYVVKYIDKTRKQHPQGTRVVRLQVTKQNPPLAIAKSEIKMISWLGGGHNGGCLKFGRDGKLFVSTGDGAFAYPPDTLKAGQDVSNLLSAVLRIDVDHSSENQHYSIPKDNPFVKTKGARGEIWAYGMRNPWKISVDRKTGDLWVGDVGWQLWEMVYKVKPGDNYGWSLVEGPQPVHTEYERGPTPVVKAAVEIPHAEGASITGGFVYRGKKFPELYGHYIFGDWATRRIWHLPVKENKIEKYKELVEPAFRIVGFAERNDGELLMLDYDGGTIHELVRNKISQKQSKFPRKLSDTGLFESVESHRPANGVIPFSIQSELWADHATAERYVAIPGESSIMLYPKLHKERGSQLSSLMKFSKNAVLAKTLSLEFEAGNPKTKRRIETQLLHFDGFEWRGYSYRWNKEQTDAKLVGAAGESATFQINDSKYPGGQREQQWRFSSRMQCMRCHNPWAGGTLAFNVSQINRDHNYGSVADNQIRTLRHIGLLKDVVDLPKTNTSFSRITPPLPAELLPKLADPFDESSSLYLRGRSYLHANCAHCHRTGGGGSARMIIDYDTPLEKTEAIKTRPTQGTFGIYNAEILAPGDPYRSVMYFRMAKSGPGHMPHIGSKIIDRSGLSLIHDWIHHLPKRAALHSKIEQLIQLDEATARKQAQIKLQSSEQLLARSFAKQAKRTIVTDADRTQATERSQREAKRLIAHRIAQREKLLTEITATPEGTLLLARALRTEKLPKPISQLVEEKIVTLKNPLVRDLLESFLPDNKRIKRLGDSIDIKKLLAMQGDERRGATLFFKTEGIACRNCHQVSGKGESLGPDLTGIGKKLNRSQILENILQPSKTIDPKFRTWLIETVAGKVYSGILVKKTESEIIIRDTQRKEHRFKTSEVEEITPQQKSLMPELLLREMSAQQVADLLTWLSSLK